MRLASVAMGIAVAVLGRSTMGQGTLSAGGPWSTPALRPAQASTNGVSLIVAPARTGVSLTPGQVAPLGPVPGPAFPVQVPRAISPGLSPKVAPVAPGSSRVFLAQKPLAPARPEPGVYESKPYTCIVIVPGPHPDDRSVFPGDTGGLHMPMIKPDLHLVPRK